MNPEIIWSALYSTISMSILVFLLTSGFYFLGRSIFSVLRLPLITNNSVFIAVGLVVVMFVGWYAYRIGVTLGIYNYIVLFVLLSNFIYYLAKRRLECFKIFQNSGLVLLVFTFLFSLQALITFKMTDFPVSTLGNNDIYNWSIVAEALLGSPGMSNIASPIHFPLIDAFGTSYIIGLFANFMGILALEATSVFMIFSISVIGLSIYELVRKSFGLGRSVSFGVSLLVSSSSFFVDIAYQTFYAQLMATFFYLTTIIVLQDVFIATKEKAKVSFISRTILPAFSLAGILLAYQSGFFVFTVFLTLFCLIYIYSTWLFKIERNLVVNNVNIIFTPFIIGVFLILLLLPELALHTINRTFDVYDVVAGWPLPLLSPVHLFSIPTLRAPHSFITGDVLQYACALLILLFMAWHVFYLSKSKRLNIDVALRYFVFITLLIFSLLAYLFAYSLKGEIYQVWKFSSFVVLPVSFVFSSYFSLVLISEDMMGGIIRKVFVLLIIIGCTATLFIGPSKLSLNSTTGLSLTQISNKIADLKSVRRTLLNSGVKNIVLSHMVPSSDVMIAFSVLMKDFKLYSLVRSYYSPFDISVVKQLDPATTRVLVNAKCFSNGDSQTGAFEYEVIKLDEMDTIENGKYFFGLKKNYAGCQNPTELVSLVDGFKGRESWGVWTDGSRIARMKIAIPHSLIGEKLNLLFRVYPFPIGEQPIAVKVGGKINKFEIKEPYTDFNVVIPPEVSNKKQVYLDFHIENRISPSSVNDSNDSRTLHVGFATMNMRSSEH